MYFNSAFRKTLLGTTNSIAAAASGGTISATSSTLISTGLYLNTITVTHSLSVGQTVVIAGASPTAYNGTFTVRSVTGTTAFTVYSTVDGVSSSTTGTATGLATSVLLGATATASGDLTAGQLGIYNQNFGAINYATTTAADKAPFYLVQGSYYKTSGYSDKIGSHGGYQESVKSKMINPKYISRIFWVQSKLPVQQVVQIPLTAQSGSTNVGLNADTTYRLRIDVKGSPALRFLSHNIYRVMDTYTGPLNATNPTFQKDPVATLVDFKEQITMSPYFNQLVQARAYKLSYAGTGSTTVGTITTTSAVLSNSNFTTANGVAIGQRVTGPSIPANSFVTAFTSGTSATISFPTQSVAPTIATITGTAPSVVKFYNDLYGSNGGYVTPYTNIAVTSGQQPTYVGQTPYIPGSSAYTTGTSQTAGTATGATILANTAGTSIGAIIYQPVADAASFTTDAFLELTAAYLETKFGNPTFTISDNYDLEPLKIIASLMDDSGSTTVTAPIGTAALQTIGEAGIATVAQASSMAQGTGEMVLRELILTGRYRQEAFGDGTNIDQFRMREIEANPGVLNMMTVANRNSLYNKLCILHSVPRFNNPTGVFDNDQYLIEIAVPSAVPLSNIFNTATYVSGGTIAGATGIGLGDYILEASIAAGGVNYAEMI
jgi:hypothetical protein